MLSVNPVLDSGVISNPGDVLFNMVLEIQNLGTTYD